MPACGSQIVFCDLPVRFDTYRGCGHACAYCFANRKRNLADVRAGEGPKALRDWIAGARTQETRWCDWPIPLHWGGMADPFQPAERAQRRSLACLRIFAETGYPVVISSKGGTLLAEPQYVGVLKDCNAAVQVSMVSPRLDAEEPGAPTFAERLRVLDALAKHCRRLIVRVQPYRPELRADVLHYLPRYAAAGVYGITVEGLKAWRATPGMVKLGTDFVYPANVLRRDFEQIRARCHELGLRFYAAENRLRGLGDDLCCCGVADLPDFKVNRANLNQLVAGRPIQYTARMREPGTAAVFKALCQDAVSTAALRTMSYRDCMKLICRVPNFLAVMGLNKRGGATGAALKQRNNAAARRTPGVHTRRSCLALHARGRAAASQSSFANGEVEPPARPAPALATRTGFGGRLRCGERFAGPGLARGAGGCAPPVPANPNQPTGAQEANQWAGS